MAEKKKTNKWLIPTICGVAAALVIAIVVVVVVNVTRPGLVGKYTLAATIDAEGNESTSIVDLIKSLGLTYTIEFKDDNTGVLVTGMSSENENTESEQSEGDGDGGTITNFTYSNGKMKAENSAGVFEADYELKDGAVVVDIAGEIMKFKRM